MVGNGRSVHVAGRSAALAARGHAVRLVTLGPVAEAPGVDVRTRPIPGGAAASLGAARSFLRDIRAFAPDLLHLHYAGGRLGTMATLAAVRPLVVTVMGGDVLPEQHPGGLGPLERRATRRILEQAEVVLVKADALRPAVAALGVPEANVHTVRWGVDLDVFRRDAAASSALRDRLGLQDGDQPIASPRLLAPLYNADVLVEAMPIVLREAPRARLLLTEYGADPAYRARLQQRCVELGLGDRVVFAGPLTHAEMPALFSLSDVSVSVPSSDGLPQSLFESLACETPVVLGRLPAYAEVVTDGETALLADRTPPAIAAALVALLRDPERRRRMGAAGRRRVAEIASLPREVERVEALYDAARARAASTRARAGAVGRWTDALALLLR
jgi:glycosyltransferase involved in cell wall biosynthesis